MTAKKQTNQEEFPMRSLATGPGKEQSSIWISDRPSPRRRPEAELGCVGRTLLGTGDRREGRAMSRKTDTPQSQLPGTFRSLLQSQRLCRNDGE